jgi:8-oxo-dGTP pyrophosphatase MutT (NUDIX family)
VPENGTSSTIFRTVPHLVSRLLGSPRVLVSLGACGMARALDGTHDAYGGFIVDPNALHSFPTTAEFSATLASSLETWRRDGVRGVWLKVPTTRAPLLPICIEQGFTPHHAESDYVMLTQWLPKETVSTLPPNASHQVGVGMFVSYRDPYDGVLYVLCVQEKNGVLKGKGVWKMPTGLVNAREDITEAAVREVSEETGVSTSFDAVIALRQSHGWAFGKSDMFFVVACSPQVAEGTRVQDIPVKAQASEIEAVTWRTLDAFTSEEFFQGRPLFKQIMRQCRGYAEGRYKGLRGMKLAHGLGDGHREDLLMFGLHDYEDTRGGQREDGGDRDGDGDHHHHHHHQKEEEEEEDERKDMGHVWLV